MSQIVGGARVVGNKMGLASLGGLFKVFAMSLALTCGFASAAFADTVTNLLDNSPASTQFEEITVNEGQTRSVPLRVFANSDDDDNGDGDSGCNIDARESLVLGFNSTSDSIVREDPDGSTVTFQDGTDSNTNACGPSSNGGANPPAAAPDDRSITVRGVSRGAANITVAQPPVGNNTGSGTYTYGAATFRVIVQNVAPTANNDSYNTNEDSPLTVNAPGVLGNDTDPGNNPLTAVLVTGPRNGTLQLNANGSFVYTPNANSNGTDTFTYRTSDGQAESGLATVTLNVASVNDKPNAAPDTAATDEDRPAVLNVLDNDTDADRNALTVASNTQPQNGTVNCTPTGVCTYTPNNNFNGVDSFTYTVSDGNGGTSTATVTVSVGAANDAPNAAGNNYNVAEDGTLNVAGPGVLGNDTDPDNDPLTARVDRGPGSGTLRLNADGSFVYTPNKDFNGQDSFTYRACDNGTPQICSEPATVNVSVTPANDPPVARGTTAAVDEDSRIAVNALANDSDVDGDPLILTNSTQPQNGTANCTPAGICTYTPNANFNGEDSFTYTISDGNGGTSTATISLAVRPVNDAPGARDDSYSATEDQPLRVDAPGVLGNDSDLENNRLRTVLVGGPSNGTLELSLDGSFVYTPNADFNGTDTFTYRANDDLNDSNLATVTINVASVNDRPNAAPDTAATDEDQPAVVNVLDNDTDADRNALTVASNTQPTDGRVNCTPVGVCTYTPNNNFNGEDSFTYTVSDGNGETATATVNVKVRPVNDAPGAQDDSYTATEDQPLRVDAPGVLGDDSDPDNDRLRTVLVGGPTNGTLALAPDGSFVYTPNANFSGRDSFTYRANDDTDDSNPATVTINVAEGNDAPGAMNDAAITSEDTPTSVAVLLNDAAGPADESGQTLTTRDVVTQPTNGTAAVNPNGTVTYTPNADFNGEDSFTYRVCDSGNPSECATATVRVTVSPANDAPQAKADTADTPENTPVVVDVLGNDTPGPADESRQKLTLTSVTDPANGTAEIIREGENAGRVRYTPDPSYSGPDSFEYVVCDDGVPQGCETVAVDVAVAPLNDPPSAEADSVRANEDSPLVLRFSDLTANDSAGPGEGTQALTITQVDNPQNGTVRIENGRVVFQPNPNYSGPASFVYTVCDDADPRECDTAVVNVDVGAVNDAPQAKADTADAPEDGRVDVDVLANDTDIEGKDDLNPATVRVVGGPSNGKTVVNPLTGKIAYIPNADFSGTDAFTYEVCDDGNACSRAVVNVTVRPGNDAPVARDDSGSTNAAAIVGNSFVSQYSSPSAVTPTRLFRLDTSRMPFAFGQIGGDIPSPLNAIGYRSTDNMIYGYRVVKAPGKPGIVSVSPSTGASRFLGMPRGMKAGNFFAGDVSPDGSTYYLSAPNTGVLQVVDLATFKPRTVKLSMSVSVADLAVSPVNKKLYGVADNGNLMEIDPATGKVTPKGRIGSMTPGGYGGVWFTAGGDLIAYENGRQTSSGRGTLYQIRNVTSTTPTVVSSESGPYTIGNDAAAFVTPPNPAGLSAELRVLDNDTDPDGRLDPATLKISVPPAHGTARVNGDGTITYTTNSTYRGSDSFRYEICDADAARQCATATVNITAAPIR